MKTSDEAKVLTDREVFIRLVRTVKPFTPHLIGAVLSGILLAGFAPGLTFAVKRLFDALEGRQWDQLSNVFVLICGLFGANLIFRFIRNFTLRFVAERCVAVLRSQLAEKLLRLRVGFFENTKAGELSSKILYDSATLPPALEGLGYYITSPLTLVGLVTVALLKDWQLTLFVFLAVPLIVLIFRVVGRSVQRNARRTNESMGQIGVWMNELARGIRSIKVFSSEPALLETFQSKNQRALQSAVKMAYVQELASPLNELIMAVVAGLALLIGGSRVVSGEMSMGDLIQVVTALGLLQEPVRRMNGIHMRFMQGLAGARSLFQILDEEEEVASFPAPRSQVAPPKSAVHLSFENVTFRYGGGRESQEILRNFNLKISPGEWVGLRGKSGAGKSTVAHLVPGLYPSYSGNIRLNGQEIRDLPLQELRQHISVVTQDIFLFNDSIYHNIRMGKPWATREEVIQASKSAFIHDFILGLPQGYDTPVGDGGCRLSGGQRQRISIARAFLKNAPFIILDEATSALDKESEDAVNSALRNLMEDRSVMIIAHKESILAQAHRIVDLVDGQAHS